MESPCSETGAIRLHGTSLGLVDAVSRDVAAAQRASSAVSAAMSDRGAPLRDHLAASRPGRAGGRPRPRPQIQSSPALSRDDRWTAYVDTVSHSRRHCVRKQTGKPDLASISIEPQDLLLATPHSAGLPPVVSASSSRSFSPPLPVLAAALVATLSSMLVRDGTIALFKARTQQHCGSPP